jgi:hypothetical protein
MDKKQLEKSVAQSRKFATGLIVVLVLAYFSYFIFFVEARESHDPAAWGQFGDFIGGILNPMIAFLAFYWLTQSIQIQKEELELTRKTLEDTSKAQQKAAVAQEEAAKAQRETVEVQLKQEAAALRAASINALSALLAANTADISSLRREADYLARSGNIIFSREGNQLSKDEINLEIGRIQRDLNEAALQRRTLTLKIQDFLLDE